MSEVMAPADVAGPGAAISTARAVAGGSHSALGGALRRPRIHRRARPRRGSPAGEQGGAQDERPSPALSSWPAASDIIGDGPVERTGSRQVPAPPEHGRGSPVMTGAIAPRAAQRR